MRSPAQLIKVLASLCNLLILLAVAAVFYFWQNKATLPPTEELVGAVFTQPTQVPTDQTEFDFHYEGTDYVIEPVANYELSGLVVSHNDIFEFGDIYHDETSVDVRDLCVVWGAGLENDVHLGLEYWSEPWSCWFEAKDRESYQRFDRNSLGNNHLLADNRQIREAVWNTGIGDQVYMRGLLINYYPADKPEWRRETSTVRDDTGNGACEVLFVDEFEVLDAPNQGLREAFQFSKMLLCLFLLSRFGLFIAGAYLR